MNVLLFDEESVLRRATAMMLGTRGANVTTARDVGQLFALTTRRIFDVLVIDVTPHGPSASALLARIRAAGLVPRRVIVCSGGPLDRLEARGFTQVLVKPYPFEALVSAVFGAANRRRPTRSGVFARVRFIAPPSGPRRVPSATPDVAWLARGQEPENQNAPPARRRAIVARRAARVRRGRG